MQTWQSPQYTTNAPLIQFLLFFSLNRRVDLQKESRRQLRASLLIHVYLNTNDYVYIFIFLIAFSRRRVLSNNLVETVPMYVNFILF